MSQDLPIRPHPTIQEHVHLFAKQEPVVLLDDLIADIGGNVRVHTNVKRPCMTIIERESDDNRLFVRKAVNWALRQVGKRNLNLNRLAIASAKRIRARQTPAARWVAADALRELQSDKVQARLKRKTEQKR